MLPQTDPATLFRRGHFLMLTVAFVSPIYAACAAGALWTC